MVRSLYFLFASTILIACTTSPTDDEQVSDETSGLSSPSPSDDVCGGKKCGTPCPGMFGSLIPTYCNAKGACAPGKPVCETYDCDPSSITCKSAPPLCPPGMTASVVDGCWGRCVPLDACK